MSETEIPAAIAEQEEYLKRRRTCRGGRRDGIDDGLAHSWETFSVAPGGPTYEACWRCRVTRTREDYTTKLAARPCAHNEIVTEGGVARCLGCGRVTELGG